MAKRHPSLIPLSHDHHHALALAIRCRKQALGQLNPGNPKAMKALAEEVKKFFLQNLDPHFEAEEKVLFPLIHLHSRDAEPLIAELLREHERIRKTVTALEKKSELSKTLFDLGDLLDRHIRQEERALFPIFEQVVPANKAEKAGIDIKNILG
jgi:iron-sulfur cluster repair protein YtfE (RIC family)